MIEAFSSDRNPSELVSLRARFAPLLAQHQAYKHHAIFDQLIAQGSPVQRRVARRVKVVDIAVDAEYRKHLARWQLLSPATNWAEYRLSTMSLIRRMRDQMSHERAAIERFLLAPAMAA